jgi:hypothetical protein
MPRFLKAQDIAMKHRRPHLKRYKQQLRTALLDPGLSEVRRAELKKKLAALGQPQPTPTPTRTSAPVSEPAPELSQADTVPSPSDVASSPLPDTPTQVAKAEPEVETVSEAVETLDDLLALGKDELLSKAADEGAETFKSWNMTKIAQAILAHRAASK